MKKYTLKLQELPKLVDEILQNFENGVVILRGDLASGKTTLVKAIVKSLGCDEDVTSPTFSLQQCYGNKLYHYDIYNHGLEHFVSLGMLEELEKEGLHFIEWGDEELVELLQNVGIDTLVIDIEKQDDNSREYRVEYAHA